MVFIFNNFSSQFRLSNSYLGIPLAVVQKEVSDIIEHRTLVGHAIHNDLQVKIQSSSMIIYK